jgi:hypothetical protein
MTDLDHRGSSEAPKDILDRELVDSIVDAYDVSSLKILVRTTMGELCDCVSWDQPTRIVAFQLLDTTSRRKCIGKLLSSIRSDPDQKNNAKLLRIVDTHLRQALRNADVGDIERGLDDLGNRVDRSDAVREMVAASRKKLDQLRGSIDVLFHYKELHDCLHQLQLRHHQEIIGCAGALGRDPQAQFELQQHILDLAILCAHAREAAEHLPEIGAGRAHVKRWIDQLESAIPKLQSAVRDEDAHGATEAISPFRSVIEGEQARVNERLNEIAEELPLGELSEILAKVIASASAGDTTTARLQKALDSLRQIKARLDGSVAEHDRWQRIENDFWEAADQLEDKTPEAFAEFRELWQTIKSQVEQLALPQLPTDWAKNSQDYARQIDEAMARPVDSVISNFETLRGRFRRFRENALYHFFWVDRGLKAQCAEILDIRKPLQSLLNKV